MDFDFAKKVKVVKCRHCGFEKGQHKAKTLTCPLGPVHRTVGPTAYSNRYHYEPK